MENLIKIFRIAVMLILFNGCNNQIKFDKNKWQEHEELGQPSPYRNKMIKDLTVRHKLVGKRYSEIVSILGLPTFRECHYWI